MCDAKMQACKEAKTVRVPHLPVLLCRPVVCRRPVGVICFDQLLYESAPPFQQLVLHAHLFNGKSQAVREDYKSLPESFRLLSNVLRRQHITQKVKVS